MYAPRGIAALAARTQRWFATALTNELAPDAEAELAAFALEDLDRVRFGLSATALAELLDVSMETVSRWEHGARDAPRPAVALLEAMVLDHAAGTTVTVDRLHILRKGPRLAKVVHVDLGGAARR